MVDSYTCYDSNLDSAQVGVILLRVHRNLLPLKTPKYNEIVLQMIHARQDTMIPKIVTHF